MYLELLPLVILTHPVRSNIVSLTEEETEVMGFIVAWLRLLSCDWWVDWGNQGLGRKGHMETYYLTAQGNDN